MSQLNSSLYSQKLNNGYFKIMKLKIQLGDTGDRTRGLSHAKRTRYHCATTPLVMHEAKIFVQKLTALFTVQE